MSKMLDRVAKAIAEAIEKPKYIVKVGQHHISENKWQLWSDNGCVVTSANHDKIDKLCDELNNRYIAQKAVEALKAIWQDEHFPYFETDKMWKELSSQDVWNLCLDVVLKDVKS